MGNEEYFTISFYFMGKKMVPTDVKRIWDIWMTGDCKHQLTWVKKIKKSVLRTDFTLDIQHDSIYSNQP